MLNIQSQVIHQKRHGRAVNKKMNQQTAPAQNRPANEKQ